MKETTGKTYHMDLQKYYQEKLDKAFEESNRTKKKIYIPAY